MGLGKTPPVAGDELIEQPVTMFFPGTLPRHEIDGAQKAYDIDNRRALRGVIEIIESPCIPRYRELFDMRVAVQSHNRQPFHISAKGVAHPREPRPVDESEIIVRVGSKSLDQFGRRNFQGFWLGSKRLPAVRCSEQADGDDREYID
jgi:hypothetical protein